MQRFNGSDGRVSCIVNTEALMPDDPTHQKNAKENKDYKPWKNVKLDFEPGESKKIISIQLVEP